MLSLVSCSGCVSAPVFARRQLTSVPESTSMSTNSPSRTIRTPTEQISSSAPLSSKGHLAHAADIEEASDRANHGGFLATRLTCCGQLFHRMDLLLGTLRRQVSTLATIQTRLGCVCTLASLLSTLRLGLRSSRRSTRTCQMSDFSTFSARLVGVRTVCWSVIRVSASWTCLLSRIVTFASSCRSLATFA